MHKQEAEAEASVEASASVASSIQLAVEHSVIDALATSLLVLNKPSALSV